MKNWKQLLVALTATLALAMFAGCGGGNDGGGANGGGGNTTDTDSGSGGIATADGPVATFSLAWSEYPSWSVFGVADEAGLIDKDKGKLGKVEKKWGVDIELKEADYDTCLTLYGSSTVNAVCITNMDVLSPSLARDSVAVLPTSTSDGADATITVGIEDLDGLKGKTSYGLEKSVSQYMFERSLEVAGKDPADYPFKNMDPAAAATAMQTSQENIESIVVWNPFVMQTLRTRDGSKRLFDSTSIPEEIIDMVVIGKETLEGPGGEKFACAIIDAYYQVNQMIADPAKGDDTLVALGAKFSSLPLEDMKEVVKQTRFYKSPEEGIALFDKEEFRTKTMPTVVDFCVSHGITSEKPKIGYGDAAAQLNFDKSHMETVQSR